MTKLIHPITFIDKLVKKNERGDTSSLMDHQREILRLAFDFDQDGRLPWDTILYSCVKKSGKTTMSTKDQSGFSGSRRRIRSERSMRAWRLALRSWAQSVTDGRLTLRERAWNHSSRSGESGTRVNLHFLAKMCGGRGDAETDDG
jgi:hypothetical protein